MKYQLVIQISEKLINFDSLIEIEDDFIKILTDSDIDGHDIGSGEVNFFILTNNPRNSFENLKGYLIDKELLNYTKVAYRRVDNEKYVVLYPDSLKFFSIQ